MPATPQDKELKDLLCAQDILARREFSFDCGPTGGITVSRHGHVYGVWHFEGGRFRWTPTGYNAPTHQVESVADALRYSLVVISLR